MSPEHPVTPGLGAVLPALLLALSLAACGGDSEPLPGPELPGPIMPDSVTVSGLSSGGAMAHQLHLVHADLFSGAAILAGPPFACAGGELGHALGRCLDPGETLLPVDEFRDLLRSGRADGRADPAEGLEGDRVWLFHGTRDAAVARAVTDAVAALYETWLPPQQIRYVTDIPAAHHFPVLEGGHGCGASELPFLGDCDYDAAGELLAFLYPGLEPPTEDAPREDAGNLQAVSLPGAADADLAATAWLYLPPSCPPAGCRLHLVLHGCGQAETQVGTDFITGSGYLRWARANGIVLAFPQVDPSLTNPLACWDWWGYTGDDYLWKDSAQGRVLTAWLRSLGA